MTDDNPNGLSAKHARFVDEYVKDRNAGAAAVRAGFNPRQGVAWIKSKAVQDELLRRQEAVRAERAAAIGASGALADAIALADAAYEAAERANNASAMVSAAKLRAELTGALDQPATQADVDPNSLTDADLARIISTCTCGALTKPH